MKKKILIVIGTRPEAIKMAPVLKEFQKHKDAFETKLCITAQHRQMLDQVLTFFDLCADYDLNLMKPGQDLHNLTANVVLDLKFVYQDFRPDWVLVHGDTTTSFSAALAAFYCKIKVAHVEAGLRTFNKLAPFPEELNRQLTSKLADLHFAPTIAAQNNLLSEGIAMDSILITGNTVIDALYLALEMLKSYSDEDLTKLISLYKGNEKLVLVTGHRRENFGDGFVEICEALLILAQENPEVTIVYPVHLNPQVQKPVLEILGKQPNIHLIQPLSYPSFVWLMNKALFIITDSGGIQEEAPSLGKPVLVMREVTERPEALNAGLVKLVGTNKSLIASTAQKLLSDRSFYNSMISSESPYGNGTAASMIVAKFI